MNRKYSFAPGEYYHIYNRGVERGVIFQDSKDYKRFIKLLLLCNGSTAVNMRSLNQSLTFAEGAVLRGDQLSYIGAYCLMPNHFHLLIREKEEGGIPKFMQKLMTAYTKYFNAKNERSGRLFGSTYLASHSDSDEYLKYLFSYIHLNPLKIVEPNWRENGLNEPDRAKEYLSGYDFSSFKDYVGSARDEGHILDRTVFPQYFQDREDFVSEMYGWLSYPQITKV